MQRTSPGILLGKLPYMSPEQARGEQVDLRADIYSTGVILWELITGSRLFPPLKTLGEDMARAVKPVIDPPSRVNPKLPAVLDLIARRALAPARENRYPDAEALRKDLATLLADVDVTTDATALQRFLEELYGAEAAQARQRRKELLDSMASRIEELLAAPAPPAGAQEPASAAPFGPGTILNDKYRIDRLLGEGGMGRVYQALHLGIGRDVALKVLMREFNQMDDVVARFRREAWAANRIAHPNIVEILDSGTTEDGQLYYAMELLAGIDLGELLRREGRLKADRATRIALQICQGLSAAHEAEVIHRDLKPENVFVVSRPDEPEFVKIVDFGVARMPHGTEKTFPGLAMGTPEYMAPEQAEKRGHDHRVDIYSMGVVLYEMLTGGVPFKGNTYNEVLYRKVSEKLTPPSERGVELPDDLQRLVLSALDNNPDQRPQTMQQLAYELRKILEGRAAAVAQLLRLPESMAVRWTGPVPSAPAGSYAADVQTINVWRRPAPRRYLWPLIGGVLLVVLVAALMLALCPPGGQPARTIEASRDGAPRVDRSAPRVRDAALPSLPDGRAIDTGPGPDRNAGIKTAPPKRPVHIKPKKKKRLDGTLNPFRPRRR
jgi:serine/threonine protein kinase